ncbi:shikimate dehydrogenase [Candidatus Pelagibacter sp.]|nr:shikimate dehydrogenase [Candidatus Pelagibacter sp.]
MKKFLVIGNPIEHSLSPKLHNYWIKENNLQAIYAKLEANEHDLLELCSNLKEGKLDGINVTVPFKNKIIAHLDILSGDALRTQSVNTISVKDGNLIGHNTDIDGFELSVKKINYDLKGKTAIILGAGGVVPSIIYALKKLSVSKIILTNRTKERAEKLKDYFNDIEIVEWNNLPNFDIIINATILGLKKNDNFGIDFTKVGNNKLFYDVIYQPFQTEFSDAGNLEGNEFINGLNMFLFQAQKAFNIWHNTKPKIDEKLINFLKK